MEDNLCIEMLYQIMMETVGVEGDGGGGGGGGEEGNTCSCAHVEV